MVSIDTLHYEFELMRNNMHTQKDKDTSSVDIDSYLNNAKDIILRNFSKLFEKNKTLENDLRLLEEPDYSLKLIKSTNSYNVYELPSDYYSELRIEALANCNECKDIQRITKVKYVSNNNLNEALDDPYRKPSFNWRRGIYNIAGNTLMYYHENQYNLDKVNMTYVKYLPNVHNISTANGPILDSDGTTVIKENRHLQLPRNGTLWRKIVEIAVYLHAKSIDDNYRAELDSILFNQNYGVN